jgi:large subunit ribosomal protein L10e
MAILRKASSYSKGRSRPYTRKAKSRKKAYIKTIPGLKVTKFNMGNVADYNSGKHEFIVTLESLEKAQVRDNALEACRTLLNKTLDKAIPGQYYFEIKVYPHNILRENKAAAGAGADRLSSGMKHSFGVVIGRAARLSPGKEILFVSTNSERAARVAKVAMLKIKSKVPCKTKIVFGKKE